MRMKVVAAKPAEAVAKPISIDAGRARTPQADGTRPKANMTTRKPKPYSAPRPSAQLTSPRAMSPTFIGVASMPSYAFS